MTDDVLGTDNSAQVDNFSQPDASNQGSGVDQSSSEPAEQRLFTQDEVNKVAGERAQRAYDKGSRAAAASSQQRQDPNLNANGNQNVTPNVDQQVDQRFEVRAAEYERKQVELAQQAAINSQAEQIESQFNQKLEEAKKIDGVDTSLVGDFKSLRAIKLIAAHSDNAGKVLAHLAKNPSEAARLENMVETFRDRASGEVNFNPIAYEFKKIADKLSLNENGEKKYGSIPDPISDIKSDSRDGVQNNEPKTPSEWARWHCLNRS